MGKKPAAQAAEQAKKQEESKEKARPAKAEPEKRHAHHASSKSREEQSCQIKKCKRSYKAKGYCVAHYKQWRNGKFGIARYKTCGQMDCRKPMGMNRHGYCEDHYQGIYVKGTVTAAAEAPAKKEAAAPAAAAS